MAIQTEECSPKSHKIEISDDVRTQRDIAVDINQQVSDDFIQFFFFLMVPLKSITT